MNDRRDWEAAGQQREDEARAVVQQMAESVPADLAECQHRLVLVGFWPYEDKDLYWLSGGKHGGPISLWRCKRCTYAEYR